MLNVKPMSSPMAAFSKLSSFDSPSFDDPTLFRSTVRALQYFLHNRPDISFSVNKVCQFMHDPKVSHWSVVKRIFRYLQGTINHGILFPFKTSLTLQTYSNADWAGYPDHRRSTSRYCIFLDNNLISWSSKKQKIVVRSSTEAA